jgi:hypothetical protein
VCLALDPHTLDRAPHASPSPLLFSLLNAAPTHAPRTPHQRRLLSTCTVAHGVELAPLRAHPPQSLQLFAGPSTWVCARYRTTELQPATTYEARASYPSTVRLPGGRPNPSEGRASLAVDAGGDMRGSMTNVRILTPSQVVSASSPLNPGRRRAHARTQQLLCGSLPLPQAQLHALCMGKLASVRTDTNARGEGGGGEGRHNSDAERGPSTCGGRGRSAALPPPFQVRVLIDRLITSTHRRYQP